LLGTGADVNAHGDMLNGNTLIFDISLCQGPRCYNPMQCKIFDISLIV
jgi:hypothetical protein